MKQPTKNLCVRVPADSLKKLRYISKQECRSTSSVVRMLIYTCVKKFEKEHGKIS